MRISRITAIDTLIAFVKSAAKEIAQHRVRFNLIAPGIIDTPQYRAANAGPDDARWRASVGVGMPEDVLGPLLGRKSGPGQ